MPCYHCRKHRLVCYQDSTLQLCKECTSYLDNTIESLGIADNYYLAMLVNNQIDSMHQRLNRFGVTNWQLYQLGYIRM